MYVVTVVINMYTRDVGCMYTIVLVIKCVLITIFQHWCPLFVITGDKGKMAKHCAVGPFSGDSEDWSAYVEKLDQYFIANDVTSGQKKRAIFPSICGTQTYKLIRSLVSPRKPSNLESRKKSFGLLQAAKVRDGGVIQV